MHDLVPANDNSFVDPMLLEAVEATIRHEEAVSEIRRTLRHTLRQLREEWDWATPASATSR